MFRPRARSGKQGQVCILTNSKAGGYQTAIIRRLTESLRNGNQSYILSEPASPSEFHRLAQAACQQKLVDFGSDAVKRGKISALIACGGDGTVNLAARAALDADLALGILPMGKQNNIANSLYGEKKPSDVIALLLTGKTRKIDCALAGDQPFFGAIGLGLLPKLMMELRQKGKPRFGLGWGTLGNAIAEKTKQESVTLKVDAFRFDMKPRFLSIHALPFAAGLKFSPASNPEDGRLEVVFDQGVEAKVLGKYIKETASQSYLYGTEIRMYRAEKLILQQVKGRELYLDGELLSIPSAILDITMSEKKLRVLC